MAKTKTPIREQAKSRPNITLPFEDQNTPRFSDDLRCRWCGSNEVKVGEPNSMAYLSGGALKRIGKDHYQIADDLAGFLNLGWHGAHSREGGKGPDADIDTFIELAAKTREGQFSIAFCSTACLRGFLIHCVDELEDAVAEQKRQPKSRKTKRQAKRHKS